jgi:hypothetical protein
MRELFRNDAFAEASGRQRQEPITLASPRVARLPARHPEKKPAHLPAFFSFFAARFSLSDFSGFFFSVFFWSMPLLISRSALVVAGKAG